ELLGQIARLRAEAEVVESQIAAVKRQAEATAVSDQLASQEGRLRAEIAEFQSRLEQFRSLAPRRALLSQRQSHLSSRFEELGMEGELERLSSLQLASGRDQLLGFRDQAVRLRAAAERAEQGWSAGAAACLEQDAALERLTAQRDGHRMPAPPARELFPFSWLVVSLVLLALFAAAAVLALGAPRTVAAVAAFTFGGAQPSWKRPRRGGGWSGRSKRPSPLARSLRRSGARRPKRWTKRARDWRPSTASCGHFSPSTGFPRSSRRSVRWTCGTSWPRCNSARRIYSSSRINSRRTSCSAPGRLGRCSTRPSAPGWAERIRRRPRRLWRLSWIASARLSRSDAASRRPSMPSRRRR